MYEIKPRDIEYLEYGITRDYSIKRAGKIAWKDDPQTVLRYMLRNQIKEISYECENLIEYCGEKKKSPVKVLKCSEGESIYVVIDFGRFVAGRPGFRIKAASGTVIDFIHREDDQKDLFGHNFLMPLNRMQNVIRYICRDGVQEWKFFDYDAFRYLQIVVTGASSEVDIQDIWIEEQAYPADFCGNFACSDELLNKLWIASKNTIEVSLQDVLPDNISREKAPWSGDIEMVKLPLYYLTNERKLTRHSLTNTAFGIDKTGKMKVCWPSGLYSEFKAVNMQYPESLPLDIEVDGNLATEIPSHDVMWISSLWKYFFFTGDKELLSDLYPAVKSVWEWLRSHRDCDGLLCPDGWDDRWDYMDWEGTKDPWIPLNFFYFDMLGDLYKITQEVGANEDNVMVLDEIKSLKAGLLKRAWSEEHKAFVDCFVKDENGRDIPWISEHTTAMALKNNLIDDAYIPCNLDMLADIVPHSSPVFKYFKYDALSKYGMFDKVINEFREKWIKLRSINSLNTIQEVWEMDDEDTIFILAQTGAAVPAYYLPAYILGVRPTKPGYEEFIVEPQPVDLKWMEGSVPIPRGIVKVSLRLDAVEPVLKIEVPDGYAVMRTDKKSNGLERRLYKWVGVNS